MSSYQKYALSVKTSRVLHRVESLLSEQIERLISKTSVLNLADGDLRRYVKLCDRGTEVDDEFTCQNNCSPDERDHTLQLKLIIISFTNLVRELQRRSKRHMIMDKTDVRLDADGLHAIRAQFEKIEERLHRLQNCQISDIFKEKQHEYTDQRSKVQNLIDIIVDEQQGEADITNLTESTEQACVTSNQIGVLQGELLVADELQCLVNDMLAVLATFASKESHEVERHMTTTESPSLIIDGVDKLDFSTHVSLVSNKTTLSNNQGDSVFIGDAPDDGFVRRRVCRASDSNDAISLANDGNFSDNECDDIFAELNKRVADIGTIGVGLCNRFKDGEIFHDVINNSSPNSVHITADGAFSKELKLGVDSTHGETSTDSKLKCIQNEHDGNHNHDGFQPISDRILGISRELGHVMHGLSLYKSLSDTFIAFRHRSNEMQQSIISRSFIFGNHDNQLHKSGNSRPRLSYNKQSKRFGDVFSGNLERKYYLILCVTVLLLVILFLDMMSVTRFTTLYSSVRDLIGEQLQLMHYGIPTH